jgi:flagellar export protein FliJ
MADLEPLIRFQKFKMDEKQRFIARLFAEAENIYNHKRRMLDEVSRERNFADQSMDPWVITGFLGYQGLMKKRVALINKEIERIEARIDIAREDLRTEFIELKKFEIVNTRRLERERKRLERLEAQMFDAIAIEGFRRRLAEEGLSALETV